MERQELIQIIVKNFILDLNESAKPFSQEESIDLINKLLDYLKGVYNYEPDIPEYNYAGSPFDEDEFLETNLLKPYRHKMLPFVKTRLKLYFAKDEYGQSQLFQKLKLNESLFEPEEYHEYILRIYVLLRKIKENLYLKPVQSTAENPAEAKELLENPEELEKQGFKYRNKEFTRSRQILMYHFILHLMGTTRHSADLTKLAEFGHVLFYWPVETVKNNDLYIKLRKAPLIHDSDKQNLKDLEFVKRQFESIGHTEGIALVQKEINSLKRR